MPTCRYCSIIREHARGYPRRPARHALGTSHPRCDIHWRFDCAVCGRARHFHAMAFCPREGKLLCVACAGETRTVWRRFWAWSYSYRLQCPWHDEFHDALDRLEHDRRHPWQNRGGWRRSKRGMTQSEEVADLWTVRTGPIESITDKTIEAGWDDVASWWVTRYTSRGDINREWVIDPALLRILGPVRGLRILDAGCGNGYLARRLAKRGATVEGVDLSPKLLEVATSHEAKHPLGIRYRQGNLADLSFLPDRSFDVVISNVVVQDIRRHRAAFREIFRVVKPNGRFVFSMTHPAFESPVPGRWIREPRDSERIEDRRFLAVDRYFDRVGVFWAPTGLPLVPSFHRPLRDYFAALADAGFLVRRLEEPYPSKRALAANYRAFADITRVPLFLIIEAVRSTSPR